VEKALGAGFHLTRGPAAARQAKALGELILAFAMAVAFIYLFLGAQMGSFKAPLPVLASIPPVFIGAAGALLAGGHGLTLFSGLGLLLLAGAIVREGVLLTERYRELPQGGHDPKTFIACTLSRLRPVTATALAAILALLPLALGLGEGTEIQAPLALAMVGGLFTGTLMTLYFLPALLYRPGARVPVYSPTQSGSMSEIDMMDARVGQKQPAVTFH
jgi:HAE1 family hydrophobic/amphiphilic exporter-1